MANTLRRIEIVIVGPIDAARIRVNAIAVQEHPAAVAGHRGIVEVLVGAPEEKERSRQQNEDPFHPAASAGDYRAAVQALASEILVGNHRRRDRWVLVRIVERIERREDETIVEVALVGIG